jgi:hypothetical protein
LRPRASVNPVSPECERTLSIDRWFYPCGPEMHAGLARMSEADARFGKNIDKRAVALLALNGAQSHRSASYQRTRNAPG